MLLVLGYVLYLGCICPWPSGLLWTALTLPMVRVFGASNLARERRRATLASMSMRALFLDPRLSCRVHRSPPLSSFPPC